MKNTGIINRKQAVYSILTESVKFSLFAYRIDEPVFLYAALFIFIEFVPAIPRPAFRADNFNSQIRRSVCERKTKSGRHYILEGPCHIAISSNSRF